ncbi:FTR1 family protein [Proteus hauseri]|uniref:FTR1 family protein n=1 Tax=Proteus cibi TaxID=2050966 RepID=A0ABU6EF62_9GAMM|nr:MULTISPECIES: FTR1 family protein [Proteus]MBG6031323.1 FTR1 family protein [Proteus hauseri]MBS6209660.1 FTR1 family protein [Proteus hauseri]MEB6857537.1 FTR1 family protein [Proteus cibi]MEB7089056.1 FTR1 family protein [Proteus cibi]
MGQVLFVVWRESFEALLVVGIIYAWIKRSPAPQQGMKYLWGGVVVGLFLAIILALSIYGVFSSLEDMWQSLFMIVMEILACVLIVQMVYWMNGQGKSLKANIENELTQKTQQQSAWGILLIIAIAIAREGSEVVVFLSSHIMVLNAQTALPFLIEVFIGLLVAAFTLWLFLLTSKVISWRYFFTVTGFLLLFLAVSLLLKAVEEIANLLIEMDFELPDFFIYPLWNISDILDDSSVFGNFLVSFFAYRSQPIGLSVVTFIMYWVVVALLFKRGARHAK